jgi:transcriptional regulator with XRE-family HTH domain
MATLGEYMAARKLTDLVVARQIGVSRPYLTRIRAGRRKPSLRVAAKIEAWSEGAVPAISMAEASA